MEILFGTWVQIQLLRKNYGQIFSSNFYRSLGIQSPIIRKSEREDSTFKQVISVCAIKGKNLHFQFPS